MDSDPSRPAGRRAEYAALTRRAIVDAARTLFAERGFASTRVDDIAALARVAPATVYASTGGKQGLLGLLVDEWRADPAGEEGRQAIDAAGDGRTIIRLLASGTRSLRVPWADVLRLLQATATYEPAAAAALDSATADYRAVLDRAARRLGELGDLRPGIDARHAGDVLWFYFGYSGLTTLVQEEGWSYDDAEAWLCARVEEYLLTD
jgi:AcrR family transcriptional regulator